MPDEENKDKAFVIVYADLIFAENLNTALTNMRENVQNKHLPLEGVVEIEDTENYSELPVRAEVDGAVMEKVDAMMEEFSDWVKRQKEKD